MMGEFRLRKHLQKSFCLLGQVTETSKSALAESSAQVAVLANLCEQLHCCSQVRVDSLPFSKKLPDVKEKLMMKLGVEINDKVECIQSQLHILKNGHEKLKKQLDVTIKTYRKYSSDLDTDTMIDETAVCPSMAEMLQWLTSAEKLLYQQYHMKKHLLDSLVAMDASKYESLSTDWCENDGETYETIKDHLHCVPFFLEETI